MRTSLLSIVLLPAALLAQTLTVTNPLRFLALGDSYTIGQSVNVNERWPAQLSDSLASRGIVTDTLSIIATTGWRTDNLINAITGQNLENKNYNLVSLLIGVNNQYQGAPFSQYTTEFPALLDSAIRYAGYNKSQVFVVSIPDYAYTPFGQQSSNPSLISTQIDQYNAYNKQVANTAGVAYFDITAISRQGLQNTGYVAGDGLHPSGVQYAQWVKLMLAGIQSQVVTGIQTFREKEPEIALLPNPGRDWITIGLPETSAGSRLEVYDALGKLVLKQALNEKSTKINILALPAGVYTFQVSMDSGTVLKKFIKVE